MDIDQPSAFNSPPPVITPPPRTRPARSGGRGWMIVAILLALILSGVLALEFARSSLKWSVANRGGLAQGHFLEEVISENNGSDNKFAIVEIDGIITSAEVAHRGRNMVDVINDQLKMAGKDESVKAVILKVDSPGGEVLASDDIYRALTDFQERYQKPVVAAMGGLAASGGYYVSAPCQWIVANELTMTGSIGVIMSGFNYRGLLDKVGVYPQVFKSGKFKDMLRGSKKLDEIDPEEQRMIQTMIDETYAKFVSIIEQGRSKAEKSNHGQGKALSSDWKNFADGRILTGKQAMDLGLVDQLGDFEAAVKAAKNLTKISDANLIRYQEPFNIGSLFGLFGRSESSTLKLDLGIEMPKLQAGRPYFLAPTVAR